VQLTPRYDGPPVLRIESELGDPAVPLLRQRRRLAELLAGLDADEWQVASRCEGWSVKDVITHLVSTNQFWAMSITAGLSGTPTRFLATFDPVASPAELVDNARSASTADVLTRFIDSTESMAAALDGLDDAGWACIGEAPPGHVPLRALALHALWDAWIHERDIAVPLGRAQVEEPDEVRASLLYAAALSPTFHASMGSSRSGAIAITASDPAARFVVEAGETVVVRDGDGPDDALRLDGAAIDLLEALSFRAPLGRDVPAEQAWLLDGLATVFDRTS
jgi:uncharacterized protein (TIGR03083 family)